MKTEKKQFCNRMNAAIMLLALACVNGYAQEENKSSNNDGTLVSNKNGLVKKLIK